MLKNYFKSALRNLRRNKAYTAINIFGLSVSLAVAIVLFKVIVFELSFDNHHQNISNIYQLIGKDKYAETGSHVPQGVVNALKKQFPGVERAASIYNWTPQVIRVNNKNFQQQNCYFIQPEWLRMIDIEWVKGSPEASLTLPSRVVLDEPTAKRLFGNENPMGKIIRFDNKEDLSVSGIIKKMPANSQYQMEMLVSYETVKSIMSWYKNDDYWFGGDSYFHGYVQLKPGANIAAIESGINKLVKERGENTSYSSFRLVPMRVNHFDTENDAYNYTIPKWLLYAWGSIGAFLLLIACINFINIATVQAFQRNRETGVRKILGSSKWQIITQFFTETSILVIVSVAIAACLANFLLPYTGQLLNTHVGETSFWSADIIVFLALISLTVILFSGAYPAFILSGFKPVQLLRSRFFSPASKGISLRQSLVVTQFVIAQVLVICTLIGTKQITYLYEKDLGFDKASVVTANMPEPRDRILRERLRRQLENAPEIENITYGLTTPSSRSSWWWTGVKHHALTDGKQQWREQFIDTNYFSFFNIPVLAGRHFTAADSTSAVTMINETAARNMGFQQVEQALGQQLEINNEKYTVTGIVRDYVSQSLKSTLTPHIYFHNGFYETVIFRIKPGLQAQAVKRIEREWQQVFPENYFSATFLDEDLKQFYSNESKLANFVSVLAAIGILIGCLGVYGLVSFICIRRTKEIGIRKVLGASLANILALLSSEFMRLIIIAFLVATPVAWYIMNAFLQDYTYRILIPWWIFLLSGAGALLITFVTISFQAVKAALANPVKSLRTE
jgi:putative ABC transport system permease protein